MGLKNRLILPAPLSVVAVRKLCLTGDDAPPALGEGSAAGLTSHVSILSPLQ